jgi:ParB/RepB/Spo0J family partition protein
MELRKIDPSILKEDPHNPRQSPVIPALEDQLYANIKAVGLIQPPIFKEKNGEFLIVAGARRVRACIRAGLTEIDALYTEHDDRTTMMHSFAENVVRAGLGTVDTWRYIEAMAGADWTEEAIAVSLNIPPRSIRRLRLCGSIHPAVLDQMAKGDEPNESQLRTIASALKEDQAEAWKKHKPKKNERTSWWDYARALDRRRLYARDAAFDDTLAKAHGIIWMEDLFAEGDQDNRYTTQVDDYLGAQHEHMSNTMPKRGVILTLDGGGDPKLPPKAERNYGPPRKGDILGHYVSDRTGKIEVIAYRMPEDKAKSKAAGRKNETVAIAAPADGIAVKTRAPVTQAGMSMIGDFRTAALHKAFAEDAIDDLTLIGLLVLAFCGNNVDVRTGIDDEALRVRGRDILAARIAADGVLTADPETLRQTARDALRIGLSLRDTTYGGNSGIVARVAGVAVNADRHLPTMGTEEFMTCLSKSEMEAVGSANGVLPRQTGKATRAALIEKLKNEAYVYPPARFALSNGESNALADRAKSAGRFAHSLGNDGDGDDQAETDLDTPPWDEPEAEAA